MRTADAGEGAGMARWALAVVAVCLLSLAPAAGAAQGPAPLELRGREGFWRIARDEAGACWFLSPDGRREFLNCVTTVQPALRGRDARGPHYLAHDYRGEPSLNDWASATAKRVESFGFKGIGAWSEPA